MNKSWGVNILPLGSMNIWWNGEYHTQHNEIRKAMVNGYGNYAYLEFDNITNWNKKTPKESRWDIPPMTCHTFAMHKKVMIQCMDIWYHLCSTVWISKPSSAMQKGEEKHCAITLPPSLQLTQRHCILISTFCLSIMLAMMNFLLSTIKQEIWGYFGKRGYGIGSHRKSKDFTRRDFTSLFPNLMKWKESNWTNMFDQQICSENDLLSLQTYWDFLG